MNKIKLFFGGILLLTLPFMSISQEFDDYMSIKGKGLYFYEVIPKHATLKLISKKEIDKCLQYADFYEDEFDKNLYLKTWEKALNVKEIKDLEQEKKAGLNASKGNWPAGIESINIVSETDEVFSEFVAQESFYPYNSFITRDKDLPGLHFKMPQHHTFGDRLQALNPNRPGFNVDKVLYKLNTLGLEKSQYVKCQGGGFNIIYDRLFINDEDENKLLVIWLNNDRVYANFLSNSGEWEFATPKIIHTDITCTGKDGETLARNLDGYTDKSTLITELNCIKSGDKYYVGYSITSWESTPCFFSNLASCHLLLLDKNLDVEKSVQIPSSFTNNDYKIFASDSQMKIYSNNDTICVVIQSPNTGNDKLFVQCFDKNLQKLGRMMYLSCSSNTYADLIPVIDVPYGFFVTYKEKRKNTIDIYTQFISLSGGALQPSSVYSLPKSGNFRVLSYYMKKDTDGNFAYYFVIEDTKTRKVFLYQYQLTFADFWKTMNYKITAENWRSDQEILEIDKLVKQTDLSISQNKLNSYKKNVEEGVNKYAWVNHEFVILKYSEDYKWKTNSLNKTVYYGPDGAVRHVKIDVQEMSKDKTTQTRKDKILVYFNSDGVKIWEIRTDLEGKIYTDQYGVRSEKYLYNLKLSNPFEEFHEKMD